MSRFLQSVSALAFFITLNRPYLADPADIEDMELPLKMTLRVYNYARLPRWTLDRTSKETARIFDEIGVGTSWVECPISETEIQKFQGCLQPLGPTDVVLKIMPWLKPSAVGFRDIIFGFAAGFQIIVVLSRVEEVAKDWGASRTQILAVVIAHEIGHVLLGPESHSPNGIMRSQWSRGEFQRFTRESFRFSPEQIGRMRAELLLRIRKQKSSGTD